MSKRKFVFKSESSRIHNLRSLFSMFSSDLAIDLGTDLGRDIGSLGIRRTSREVTSSVSAFTPLTIGRTIRGRMMRSKEHGHYGSRSFRRKYHYSEGANEACAGCLDRALG